MRERLQRVFLRTNEDQHHSSNSTPIFSLQAIRGFAILLIFLSHCQYLVNDGVNRLDYWGGAGVSLFVCMSGFLTARGILEKLNRIEQNRTEQNRTEQNRTALEAYCSKWRGFAKLHLITLVFALPFSISQLLREPLRWLVTLLANMSMMHSLLPWKSVYFSFNAVSWYLTLPLFFALLTPLTVKFLNVGTAKLTCSIVVLIYLEFLLCLLFGKKSFAHWLLYVCPPVRYLDFLIGGGAYVLIKAFFTRGKQHCDVTFPAFLLFCSALIASMFYRNMWFVTFMWTVPSVLLIGSAYIATEKHSWGRILFENKILVEIGNISYGIFLTHQLLIRYITKIMGVMGLPVIIAYPLSLVSTIAIAYAIKKRGNLRA